MTESIAMQAPVVGVVVLEDRASVTRRGACSMPSGQHRIVVEGVSPVLADKTLLAAASGARVLDARCERYLRDPDPDDGSASTPLAVLRVEHDELEAARDAAHARAHAMRVEIETLTDVVAAALADLATAAARGHQVDAAQQMSELDRLESTARARCVDAELEADTLDRALSRLDDRIERAAAEAGDDAARLVVDVTVESPSDVVLELSYVVPGAAWRPYHRAVLDPGGESIAWETTACVWQATGEDWTDVALTCSLEQSSLGVEPPELEDDVLRVRRRADSVVVETREQFEQTTGLGGGAEVPGIDDGGIGLTLAAPTATIRADGRPHRIGVGGFTAAVQRSLVATPVVSPWVHHRVRIVNPGPLPLLAGPVDLVMASGYVGRAEIGFVAAGEKFYVGFGPESEIRIHRDETRERNDAGMLGGWNVQTVRVAVRLSNLGAAKREIVVTERIPISEVEQVQVEAAAADAYLLGTDDHPGGEEITQVTARALDDRGFVSWSVELPPFGRRAVTLEYRIRSQRGVAGV